MAIINLSGAETGDFAECSGSAGTVSVQGTVKRTGSYAYRANPTGDTNSYWYFQTYDQYGRHNDGVKYAAVWVRFYLRIDTAPSSGTEGIVFRLGLTQIAVRLVNDGGSLKLRLYDSAGSLLGTGSAVLTTGTWYRVEVAWAKGEDAAYELRIDGNTQVSGSGNLGTTDAAAFYFGRLFVTGATTTDLYIDDICIRDDTWPGAGEIKMLSPSGAGAASDWSASAGNAFECVDELSPNGDDDYISVVDPAGATEHHFALPDAASAGIAGTVNAAKGMASEKYVTTQRATRVILTIGGSAVETSALSKTTGYVTYAKIGAPTLAQIDAMQIGIGRATNTGESRCSWMAVMVDYTPGEVPGHPSTKRMGLVAGCTRTKGIF